MSSLNRSKVHNFIMFGENAKENLGGKLRHGFKHFFRVTKKQF